MQNVKVWLLESHDRRELIIYAFAALFGLVLPVVDVYFDVTNGVREYFDFSFVAIAWIRLLPYFLLFIFNDLVLSPLLVKKRNIFGYVLSAVLSAVLMTVVLQYMPRYADGRRMGAPMERHADVPFPSHSGEADVDAVTRQRDADKPPHAGEFGRPPQGDAKDAFFRHAPFAPFDLGGPHRRFFSGPMIGDMAIALLLLCFNVAVKLYLLSLRDKERMLALQHQTLSAELDQLKYQLSPHFMMNTLNNIHALIDIDAEKAKLTVVQLSKLMRYMLYESNKPKTSLADEVSFMRGYVELMRIRFTESVKIDARFPDETFGISLPPLLFVTMIENAFKHGVSYSRPSFISIDMSVADDHKSVNFCCTNSLSDTVQDGQHGIGLVNVRKRLELLCKGRYNLNVMQLSDRFVATLSVGVV